MYNSPPPPPCHSPGEAKGRGSASQLPEDEGSRARGNRASAKVTGGSFGLRSFRGLCRATLIPTSSWAFLLRLRITLYS